MDETRNLRSLSAIDSLQVSIARLPPYFEPSETFPSAETE
jgi:hypothetical protein